MLGLFKDKYVHLGWDEVPLDCWNTNPNLQRFMNRNNLYDVKDLLNVYTKKLVDIIANIGAKREQVGVVDMAFGYKNTMISSPFLLIFASAKMSYAGFSESMIWPN